ncbi:MAG: thiamine diphosphokinase [Desulfobacteraceae bacterium]
MNYVIIANGTIAKDETVTDLLCSADRIVCADGGAVHLTRMNIVPHLVIGDMDSMDEASKDFVKKNNITTVRHPRKKDASDTELAVSWAIENNASHITIIGATGTRMDHTLTNIFLMKKICRHKISCRIVDDHNELFLVSDILTLSGKPGNLLSIIPITERAEGVTLKGVEYPLDNKTIAMGSSLGISNSFSQTRAEITISRGVLLVTKSKD